MGVDALHAASQRRNPYGAVLVLGDGRDIVAPDTIRVARLMPIYGDMVALKMVEAIAVGTGPHGAVACHMNAGEHVVTQTLLTPEACIDRVLEILAYQPLVARCHPDIALWVFTDAVDVGHAVEDEAIYAEAPVAHSETQRAYPQEVGVVDI